jgi:hypothetical protein
LAEDISSPTSEEVIALDLLWLIIWGVKGQRCKQQTAQGGLAKGVRNNAFAHINNPHLRWHRGVAVWHRRSVVP